MQLRTFTTMLTTIIVVNMLPVFATSVANPTSQPQSFVNYLIPNMNGWHYIGENPKGDSYLFQNSQQTITITLKKEPVLCENSQEFNKIVLKTIQDLPKTQEYMEQRKAAVPISFLGQKNGHILIVKSRANNQRRFVLNHLIGTQMYHIEIAEAGSSQEPSAQAVAFIGQIAAGDGKGSPPPPESPLVAHAPQKPVAVDKPDHTVTENKVPVGTQSNGGISQSTQAGQSQTTSQTLKNQPSTGSSKSMVTPTNWQIPSPIIEKGNIPEVKFSATDPCAPGSDKEGLPWQKGTNSKIDLPAGVNVITPPAIPDIKSLSQVSYNSAVSVAFEAMRLLYGPMPDDEARKFEAAWTPLFDFPTKEIVDYLNGLTPLVSNFLACRESYVRTINDMQMVMYDAALAIEDDEQIAWETIMAEAALYRSVLQSLEETMKKLALDIEVMGNPPDPNKAKCEARQRYNRFFSGEYPFEGEWISDEGKEFLLKVGYRYPDGKVLVYWFPISWLNEMEAKGYDITEMGMQNNDKGDLGIIPGIYDLLKVMEEIEPGFWVSYLWTFDRTMFVYRPNNDVMQVNEFHPPSGWSPARRLENYTARKTREVRTPIPIIPFDNNTKNSWEDLVQVLPQDNWAGNKIRIYTSLKQENFLSDLETALYGVQDKNDEFNRKKQEIEKNKDLSQQEKELALSQLEEEYADTIVKSASGTSAGAPSTSAAATPKEDTQSLAEVEAQARKEAIAFHNEMVNVIKHNLERDMADRNEAIKALRASKTPEEAKRNEDRVKEFNLRIIHHQSNMQAEQDLADSHRTGRIVRNRTVFDDYAHASFIDSIRSNAARMDGTRRIAERINRQIENLPPEMRAEARDRAEKILDAQTVGSGDIEKARKLALAVTNQVQGYAGYDYAMAKEAEVNSEQNEFYAQMAIVAAGAAFVGMGSAALAEAYGAQAAITIYGGKALGALYGGTTGAIAGGPKEGVTSAISYWSPYGYAATQFVDGFQKAGYQKDAELSTQIWEGAKQAGTAWFMGKAFELGSRIIAKGSLVAFGKDSRLFKPVVQTPSQRSKQVLDGIRTQQKLMNAQDEINTFRKLEADMAILRRDPVANAQKIVQLDKELNQLAAGLNMSYYAKWNLKYKADALTRSKFDRRVQSNYAEMTPGMKRKLEQLGYNMDNLEFMQFRNHNSGGTSSMDLDLVPVIQGTKNEPGVKMFTKKMVIKKDGSVVSLEQFTDDAQKAMNAEYRSMTGLSAPASDMNLVTSVHKEAFSTPKLLDHNIDFSTFTPDEVASIGKVLQVKMDGINKNQMLSNTTKMQARCRESSKEIENMLLRKLNSDLQKVPAGSPQRKQIESDIRYWEDMLQRFKTIGTDETNPSKIMELNRDIMKETGGRDVNGVINDLTRAFGT
jgi:hypothetical protein